MTDAELKLMEGRLKGPITITISGPMGSGKSIIAALIKGALLDRGAQHVEFVKDLGSAPLSGDEGACARIRDLAFDSGECLADRPDRKIFITEKIED